jgi:hypothetical protein
MTDLRAIHTTKLAAGTMSVADYIAMQAKPKKSKFKNIRCSADGIGFASIAERDYYLTLKLRVRAGEVRYFLRQVPVHLPGEVRYVVDFLEFHADGTEHYIDVKGVETKDFKTKKRVAEATYPIVIETVKGRR